MTFLSSSKLSLALLIPVSLLTLSGCADSDGFVSEETVSIEHNGNHYEVGYQPRNLVVLDLPTLDAFTGVDYTIAGVPQTGTQYPNYMSVYTSEEFFNAGGYFEPDFERINAEQPELIITGGRAQDAGPELARIAPTIDLSLEFDDVVNGIESQLNAIGRITGEQARADELMNHFRQRIEAVSAKAETAGSAMVVMIVGGRISAYGEGSRFGFVYDELGFEPAMELENRGNHGNPMSFELLLRTNPDWLFVLSRDEAIGEDGSQSAAQVMNNDLVHRTNASLNDQIIYLDSSSIYIGGGLHAYLTLIDQVEAALE